MTNNKKYILVVDDNLNNLQVTAKLLRDEGYLISLAQDGPSALAQLEYLLPDLILLDIMMPGIDGFELCRIIKSKEKISEIPVIFLTAKDQVEDLTEGFDAGGVDFITKPFKRQELLVRVKNHVELAESKKRILEMNKTRDKLYSIIAHDIKSPFSSIRMTINSLAAGYIEPESEEFREVIKHLDKSVNETSNLLDNLLDYTRYMVKGQTGSPEIQDILPVMLNTITLFNDYATEKKINLKLNIPESIYAYFDESSMHSVFRNLISNAIKFTGENGMIHIDAEKENKFVRVTIKDTGVGIGDDIIERVLIKNDHYTSSGTKNEKGSGLGLFIVRDLLNMNNCQFKIQSKPEEGTEFTILIPSENKK